MIPAFLSELVRTVVIMTITGGLLCLLLLAIKPVIRHRLPKSAQYYFWLVVLGALLIPVSRLVVLPDISPNIAPIHSVVERTVISVDEHVHLFTVPPVRPPDFVPAPADRELLPIPPAPVSITFTTIFMFVYPWAVLLILIFSLAGYIRFVKKIRRGYVEPQCFELDMLGELAKGKRTPKLIKSTYAVTPMLIGIFKPVIVLPNRDYPGEQLHGILLHELTHMRRFDVFVKWFSIIACAVHWFNPLVWIARREIDRACELACDEAVVRNMDANNKQNYGETLIAVTSDKKIPLSVISTTMCAEKRAIKERLAAIMKSKKHTKLAILVSALILTGVVITACALGAAGGSSANGNDDGTFMSRIIADGERIFVLENMTDRERLEQMTSITLYADGTATVANAPISSFLVLGSQTTFVIVENELAIYLEGHETAIARFTIIDNDTLEFLSADVPLRAEVGARYVFTPDWRGVFGDNERGTDANISDLCDHGGLSVESMIRRASSLNMLAFSTHADDDLISNFVNSFGFVHEVNAVYWEADWHHTLVFWVDTAVRDLSLEIFGETVVTITSPSHDEAIVVKVAPSHYLQPCGAIIITEENGTQHRIYFIQDMGADMICWCFWPYVLRSPEVYSHEISENSHPFAVALAHFNANATGDTKAFLVDVDGNNTPGMLVIDLYGFPMGTLFYLHNGVIRQADVGGQDAGFVSSMTVSGRRLVNTMGDGGSWSFTLFDIDEGGALVTAFTIYVIGGGIGGQNAYYMFIDTPQDFPWDNRYAITHDEYNALLSRYGLDNVRGPWWNMDDESNIIMSLQSDVVISFSAMPQDNHQVTVFSSNLPAGFAGFTLTLHEAHALPSWVGRDGFFIVPNNEVDGLFYLKIAQLTDYSSAEEWVYRSIERANIEWQMIAGVDANVTYTPPTADFPFFTMERRPASYEGHLMQRFIRDNGKGGVFIISLFMTPEQWDGWHGETLMSALASFEVLAE